MWPAIIIVSSIVGLWLIIVLSIACVIAMINKHLKRRTHAINVIMAQKFDLLISLSDLMKENGIAVPNSISETLNTTNYSKLPIINTQERLSLKTLLTKTFSVMFEIADNHGLEKSNRYITIKNSIDDIDEHHRKEIALFNNDVKAYNYWIKSILFRPIKWLFRIKEKEMMN